MRNQGRDSAEIEYRTARWASVVAIRLIWASFGALVALGMVGMRSLRSMEALRHLGWVVAFGAVTFALCGPKILRYFLNLDHHDRPY